ncbi:hypothetical protein F441_18319 [Phytophthora nicotianae CJ01A1]|uniref:Nucleotide-diphospho-sugar transferase domain-containing protein n=5 Tax=Phytophthora nicotianae TaxID=4792 RepID=W2YDS2_PHYNI|nr:hypothetical protein F444_18450 [Phytophthora nicotianae P1976]ETP04980.1 hypothetical protein F441_18319 [Phytophthora nicotianae CJ01A1]ETP33126.1 hypothetical protein F442_18274 [Phytophthora nicotianae P10297]KUF94353.1 hypothetical protein AM588_10007442 [Phytophthora nicotianae]KUG01032.1 Glucose N-acetyltransferase 1 [Phytophthora nicotianae]
MFRAKVVPKSRQQDDEMLLDKDRISRLPARCTRAQYYWFALVLVIMLTTGISGLCLLRIDSLSPEIVTLDRNATTATTATNKTPTSLRIGDQNETPVSLQPKDQYKTPTSLQIEDQNTTSTSLQIEDQDKTQILDQDKTSANLRIGDQDNTPHQKRQVDQKRFAYFFYVTSNTYACAAIQFIHHLVNDLQMNSSRIDVVVMHTIHANAPLLHKLQDRYHVRTILVDSVKADATEPTWRESLTKLRAFQDWGYDRVVFFDADAVPMANLDHLFDLPPATLYAPTAYWLEQPFFASTLLVIEPSDEIFNDMIRWARERGPAAGFDMDILNTYFANSVRYLPGVYTVLNSDFRRAPTEKSTLFDTTAELKEKTRLVHFSCKPDGSYGKPWNWPSHDLSLLDGARFDPLFRQLFVEYWHGEQELCAS